jgi:hypothetical protein
LFGFINNFMAYSFFPNDFHNLPNLQDNATMNYLTQHYKNLSEQLQAKVNHLQNLLEAYPGGMTPARMDVFNKGVRIPFTNATPEQEARADRARGLRNRANATDRRRAAEDQARDEATVSGMPDFHNTVIAHMATAFGDRYGQNTGHGRKLTLQVAEDLHKRAGEGGFRDYAHASGVLHDYMQDSDHVRDHKEEQAILDPTKYGVHSDDIMDVDMSDEISEDHAEISDDIMQGLLRKKP